jgi:TolB-like protein
MIHTGKTHRIPEKAKAGSLWVGMVLSATVLCGCTIVNPVVPETGHYYINPDADFARISRVVVFAFDNQTEYPSSSADLTQAVTDGLQRKNLFSLRIIARNSDIWQDMQLDKPSFTNQELLDIRKRLSADAMLIGCLKEYRSYPHLMASLNLKLIDLNTGGVLWGLEQIWDSTDQPVQKRMKMYYRDKMGDIYAPLNWQVLITSPREFHKFVADEVAQTLPHAAQILKMRPSSQ